MAYVISNACTACGACAEECPESAIHEGKPYTIDPEACIDCGLCESVCPETAISAGA